MASTFSGLRVGAKGSLAGVTKLVLAVDTTTTGIKGSLPAGARVLSGTSDTGASAVTTGTAAITTVTAGVTVVSNDISAQANPVVEVTAGLAGTILIEYMLSDPRNGAND